MKAYQLHAIDDLRYEDCQIPEIRKGWGLVKVKASGICSSDISRIFTKGTYHFPTIPGHEISGIVEKVGDCVDNVWVGKRVGVFPLIPCYKCVQCKNKYYEMCTNYDYVGSRRNGGFAELVAVPIWNLIEIPSTISYEEAAMLEPVSVALHAVKKGKICNCDKVAILGTGVIGFAAAQWSKILGASDVCVIGRSKDKSTIANSIGVNYVVDNNCSHALQYDVVIEAVGHEETIRQAINIAKPAGRVVLVGNPIGDILFSQDDYWKILRKQLSIIGTWNSSYEPNQSCDWTEARDSIVSGIISVLPLVSHFLPQDKLLDGLRLMKNHQEPYCKVLINWNNN